MTKLSGVAPAAAELDGHGRLSCLESACAGLKSQQKLQYALDQAVAELGGVAGMVHWSCGPADSRLLRLTAVSGLPRPALQEWAEVAAEDTHSALCSALRDGRFAWMPAVGRARAWDTESAVMMAALPLIGPEAPLGTLSVLTTRGRPTPAQRAFLHETARWVIAHVPSPGKPADRPWRQERPAGSRSRTAPDEAVGHAIRHMSDAFFSVDRDWRITFLNGRAERLLGPATHVLGRRLWEGPAGRVAGLEARCRLVTAEGAPVGLDHQWPTDGRWYHMRLVPVPQGMTAYLTDVTDERMRAARRVEDRRARLTPREVSEQAAAKQTGRIGELAIALSEAVTMQDVVDVIADHVMPQFGAAGMVVQDVEQGRIHVVGAVGYSEDHIRALERLPLSNGGPVEEAAHTHTPQFIESLTDWNARYPHLSHLLGTSSKQAWAFLPVIASGHPVGCLVLSFYEPHHFTHDERDLLTALSGMVAQALSRARLYDIEHALSQTLQRGLLPRALPPTPALTTAARYLPASSTAVGGDWYDVIPLSADRVALVIGDVMGHGLAEAATMGRLRTAVHTLADLELPPEEILTHLNDLVTALGDDFYATCLYAVYDSTTGDCSIASAGHPPPALVLPNSPVTFSDMVPDPPLGAAEPPFSTLHTHLPEGSLLVLYTDGLVESASRGIDRGMTELAEVLTSEPIRSAGPRGGTQAQLELLCDALTGALLPAEQPNADDTAVLVARTRRLAPDAVASWELPDGPLAAGVARAHIHEQLRAWDLHDLVMNTELLASELVGNVVRHAKGPARLRLLRTGTLVCEVSDGSATTPRIRRATDTDEGGRGLQLVAALSQRWGTRYTSNGKCIWTEQPLPVRA